MSDAAQFEPRQLEHEVYAKPFPVKPAYEMWPTPGNYRENALDGKALPPKIKVWRVQNTGKDFGGVVSCGYGYSDSPDAEVLAPGYNEGKQYGDVGIGRHASFLQWGFSAPPSQMTDAGRALFLNCICYVRKFDGKPPLIRAVNVYASRQDAVRYALLIDRVRDKSFLTNIFSQAQLEQYRGKAEAFAQFWQDNAELVYREGSVNHMLYCVDEELKSAGIPSNRTAAALGQMIGLLRDPNVAEKGRLLLRRYTEESFQTPEQWQAWFDAGKDRIYFSDVGGYRFRVVPAGY
jgi:hypothetical protein